MNPPGKFERWLAIVTNLAVAIGVVFAAAQLWQNRTFELRKNAIDLTSSLRSKDFNAAYRAIREQRLRGAKDANPIVDEMNLVVAVYDNIAIMYFNDLLNKKIIEDNISTALPEIYDSLVYFGYPEPSLKNIRKLTDKIRTKR